MIKYNLNCQCGNQFESWFRNSSEFDTLMDRNLIFCPLCDSNTVNKAIMSPRLNTKYIKSEWVGHRFFDTIKGMELGKEPLRNVTGFATSDQVEELQENGYSLIPQDKSTLN